MVATDEEGKKEQKNKRRRFKLKRATSLISQATIITSSVNLEDRNSGVLQEKIKKKELHKGRKKK